jgi:hypothetical protein
MTAKAPTKADMELARQWRNVQPEICRNPGPLMVEQQERFYEEKLCGQPHRYRFWAFWEADELCAVGGVEKIEWENRKAEITLVMPSRAEEANMYKVLEMLCRLAFNWLGLEVLDMIVYQIFAVRWDAFAGFARDHGCFTCHLPNQKYWMGKYWPGLYIQVRREDVA